MKLAALILSMLLVPYAMAQEQNPPTTISSLNKTNETNITQPIPPIQKTTTTIKPTSSTYKSQSRVTPLPPKETGWTLPDVSNVKLPDIKTSIPIIGIIILVLSYLWHLGKDENNGD